MTETATTEATARDWGDLAHPIRADKPGDEMPAWKDNAFICFWDQSHGAYGVVHVSTSPNAEGRRARASLSVNGRIAEIAEDLDPGTFASESISFGLDGDIEVDAEGMSAKLDLAPRGKWADYSTTGIVPELVPGEPLQHFQAASIVTGMATVGDESAEVDGVGMRDRTWGFRDESSGWNEYIGIVLDIEGKMLTIMKFLRPDGDTITSGFLCSEDDPVETNQLEELTRDASGLFAAAKVTTTEGEVLDIKMTRRPTGFWVPMGWTRQGPTMSAYDELIEVELADGRSGQGVVEQGMIRQLA